MGTDGAVNNNNNDDNGTNVIKHDVQTQKIH
jgi:hypothetical protein